MSCSLEDAVIGRKYLDSWQSKVLALVSTVADVALVSVCEGKLFVEGAQEIRPTKESLYLLKSECQE